MGGNEKTTTHQTLWPKEHIIATWVSLFLPSNHEEKHVVSFYEAEVLVSTRIELKSDSC